MASENEKGKVRKEVHLNKETVDNLQKQAEDEGRTLKNFMENVLVRQSKEKK